MSMLEPWEAAGWGLLALAGLAASAMFSGAEIGLFSLSRVRLRLRMHHGDARALLLRGWLEEPTYPLQGLLVLQNITGFAFSAAITALLAGYGFGPTLQALVSTLIITPMVLIFADILPKDLFHRYADRWVYPLVPVLRWAFRALTVAGILPVMRVAAGASTWLVDRLRGLRPGEAGKGGGGGVVSGPRTEILQLFEESAATGVVTDTQQDLVQRALRMARITIREVMIPWNRVIGVPATISREGFRAVVRRYNVSRLPVLGRSTTEVLGMVETLDVLNAERGTRNAERGGGGGGGGFDLRKQVQPVMTLIGEQSVRSAITLMQKARQTLAVVVDRQGRAIGLVTMKDLIEELIGDVENW